MKLKHTRESCICTSAHSRASRSTLLFETLWRCISIFMYREAAFCFFFVSSLSSTHTRGLLLCARVKIVVVQRVREKLRGHVPPKKTTLSLSLFLSLASRAVAQQKFAELLSFGCLRRLSLHVALAERSACSFMYRNALKNV